MSDDTIMRAPWFVPLALALACGQSRRDNVTDAGDSDGSPRERTKPHVTLLDPVTYRAAVDGMSGVVTAESGSGRVVVTRLAASGRVEWSLTLTTGDPLLPTLGGLAVDGDGNAYVAGTFSGTLSAGGFSLTSVVNPGQNQGFEDPHGVASGDAFVLKLNRAGNAVWLRGFGGVAEQRGLAVATAPDGTLGLALSFEGRVDLGPATYLSSGGSSVSDLLLVRLDAEGNPLGARSFRLTATALNAACFDGDGSLLIAGSVPFGPVDSEFGTLPDADWVIKFDPDFAPLWRVSTDDEHGPAVTGLGVDSRDNVLLALYANDRPRQFGEELGDRSIGFAKLDADGQLLFSHAFGDEHLNYASDLTVLSDDSFALAGSRYSPLDLGNGAPLPFEDEEFQGELFAARFDGDGALLSQLDLAAPGEDYAGALVALPDDTLVFTGTTTHGPGLGDAPRQGTGYGFVAWLGTLL